MEPWLDRLKKYQVHIAVASVVLTWAVAFRWGFATSEWGSLWWGSAPPTRGKVVVIKEKEIETAEERRKRLGDKLIELDQAFRELRGVKEDLRKGVLGDGRPTRGDTPRGERQGIPEDVASYTQRDVCIQMQMEYPQRFGDLDCMSDEYDDTEPWFRAPRRR